MILAVQTNSEARPCGWGLARTEKAAREEAERQWKTHECYPGEEKGQLVVYRDLPEENPRRRQPHR